MKEDQMKLNGLIQKVMDQMDERRYGKKIITRYRSSFRLLISVSHDIGEDRLSERLMKAFLDRPVSCGEKWAIKELAHRKRCLRLLLSLMRTGNIGWRRQDTGGISEMITNKTFRSELECFTRRREPAPIRCPGINGLLLIFSCSAKKADMGSCLISGQMI